MMEHYCRTGTRVQCEYYKRPTFGDYTYSFAAVVVGHLRGQGGNFSVVKSSCDSDQCSGPYTCDRYSTVFGEPMLRDMRVYAHCLPDAGYSLPTRTLYAITAVANESGNLPSQYMVKLGYPEEARYLLLCQTEVRAHLPLAVVHEVVGYLFCGQPRFQPYDGSVWHPLSTGLKGNVTADERVSDASWQGSCTRLRNCINGDYGGWRPGAEHHLALELEERAEAHQRRVKAIIEEEEKKGEPPPPGPPPGSPPGPPAVPTVRSRKRKHQ